MSDQATLAPDTSAAPAPVAPPAAAAPAPAPATPAAATPAPAPAPEPVVASDYPDDWRDKFVSKAKAEDREKLTKRLARFASPENVLASYLDLEKKVSAGTLKPTLGENANDEDVASFRKSWGIPDKPEEYGIAFPEAFKDITDADKAELGEFMATAHKLNAPAPVAKGMAEWYFAMREKAIQQEYDAAYQTTINRKAEIKAEYGRDSDRNLKLASEHLSQELTAERTKSLIDLVLTDGTRLGDHPEFVRYVVQQALKNADATTLVTSDLTGSGQSFDEAYRAALDLKFTDPKAYHSDGHQKKLATLAAAKAKQKAA